MTVQVKHQFQSVKSDGADSSQIQPSHWNSDHTLQVTGPTVLGKNTAGAGAAVELGLSAGIKFDGVNLTTTPTLIATPTSRSIATSDFENLLVCSSAVAITIPDDTTLGISGSTLGYSISFYAAGASIPTFVTTAVTMRGTMRTITQYGIIGITRVGANEWIWL